MSDDRAFTSTPDTASGNAIAVVQVTNAASQIVDQQVVTIGDKTDGTLHAAVTASGLDVKTGTVTVSQGPVGSTAWLISGAVTVTGPVTVTGTANVVLSTGAAVIGSLAANQSVTIAATANVALSTGAAVVGKVSQDTSPWVISGAITGAVSLLNNTATIGAVTIATGAAVIGALAANQSVTVAATANVLLATGAATVGSVALVTGAAVIGALSANQSVSVVAVPANQSVTLVAVGGIAVTAVTVGVQGVQAIPTQPLRDSGRSYRTFIVASVTGVTSEALLTMNINSSGTTSTGTTYTVTAAKRLRLQAVHLGVVNQNATAGFCSRITIRVAGTVTVASAALLHLQTGSPNTTAGTVNGGEAGVALAIPDGIEIGASQQLGISHQETGTGGEITCSLIGYEY